MGDLSRHPQPSLWGVQAAFPRALACLRSPPAALPGSSPLAMSAPGSTVSPGVHHQPRGPPSPRTAIAPSPPLAPSPAPAPSSGRLFPGFSSLPGPLRWPREALGRRPALPYDPATPPSAPSVGMMRTSPGTAQSLHPNSPRFCSLPSRSWGPRPLLRESCSCPEPGILYLHKD